ncbi:hypothetical protein D3C73_1601830 [compost metagenome]
MVCGRTGDGDALLFAAREFGGTMSSAGSDAENVEEFHGAFVCVGRRFARDQLRHGYVFER